MEDKTVDTIAAISTPIGTGGISIIKISGGEARQIALNLFYLPSRKKLKKIVDRKIYFGKIKNIDEVIMFFMESPRSYTGEDIVEIQCHGGLVISEKILEEVLKNGARLAEKGEFTKRAVLNGKRDIIQAEAILDIISARSENEIEDAGKELAGKFSIEIKELIRQAEELLSMFLVLIDFPEEKETELKTIEKKLNTLEGRMQEVYEDFQTRKRKRIGIKIAIVGKPNVGKSSLLNMLLGEERAIVTEEAGTTRDTIEEEISFNGRNIIFVDTAGIRHVKGKKSPEKEGIKRTKEQIEKADIVLFVLDGSRRITPEDFKINNMTRNKERLVLLNKLDKEQVQKDHQLKKNGIAISVKREIGKDYLLRQIEKLVAGLDEEELQNKNMINIRQKTLLEKAKNEISSAKKEIENADTAEQHLRIAKESLQEIIGENITEDLIDSIFEKFCIGK
jgi:tRNA modification GTPase